MSIFQFDIPPAFIAEFSSPGEPASKARARFTKYGSKVRTYTPEKTLVAEKAIERAYLKTAGVQESKEVTYGVAAIFYHATRQRRDIDNMVKLVLDALNGVAWADDSQVVQVAAQKVFVPDAEDARTSVAIYLVGEMPLSPRLTCVECGKKFATYPSWTGKRHCSNDCMLARRRKARIRTCEECGTEFDLGKPSKARFCSRACWSRHSRIDVPCDKCGKTFSRQKSFVRTRNFCSDDCLRDAPRTPSTVKCALGTCCDCGGPTSKKKYKRCIQCMRKVGGKWAPDYIAARTQGDTA